MSEKTTEELMVRWMDGEVLSAPELAEVEKLQAENDAMFIDPRDFSKIRHAMQEYSASQDVPENEFFNRTITNRLRRETFQNTPEPVSTPEQKVVSFKNVVKSPYFGSALAACFVFGFILNTFVGDKQNTTNPVYQMVTPVVYSPDSQISTNITTAAGGQPSFIFIEGLPTIPAELELFQNAQEAIKASPKTSF